MAKIVSAAEDVAALDVLRKEAAAKGADIAARYEYAPHDAMLEPLDRLPRDRGFMASYAVPRAASVAAFMQGGIFDSRHATAFLATLSLRQILLGAIEKMPDTYFFGPAAITPEVVRSIASHLENKRERVEDQALHTLLRQFVYSGTDLDQYDRILLLLEVESTKERPENAAPIPRHRNSAQWTEAREDLRKGLYNESSRRRDSALRIIDPGQAHSEEEREAAWAELAAVESAIKKIEAEVEMEIERMRADEKARIKKSTKDMQEAAAASKGWALFCFNNFSTDQDGRSVVSVSATRDAVPIPDDDEDAAAAGLSLSVQAVRRVVHFFAGASRAYFAQPAVPTVQSFSEDAYPRVDGGEVTANSAYPNTSLPFLLEYASLLSRSHKSLEGGYATDIEAALAIPANGEAMRVSLDMALYSRRFHETQFDAWIEPYAQTLAEQNAKPFSRPRLVPLDFVARRASGRNHAFSETLRRRTAEHAERLARRGAPVGNPMAAAAGSPVSFSTGVTEPPVEIPYDTEWDVRLLPFKSALGGLFGQRWSNSYPLKVGTGKMIEDWKASTEPAQMSELCSAFPFFSLLPPPSMLLDDLVLEYLRSDADRTKAVEAYVRQHEGSIGDASTKPLMQKAWAAVTGYIDQVKKRGTTLAQVKDAARAHVKRLAEFVEEREIAPDLKPEVAIEQLNARRFQMEPDEKIKTLWELAKPDLANDYVRANTYAQQYEMELIGLRAMLRDASDVRKRDSEIMACALLYASFAYPMQQGYDAIKKTVRATLTGVRGGSLAFDVAWGKGLKKAEVVKAVSDIRREARKHDPNFVNEFEEQVSATTHLPLETMRVAASNATAEAAAAEKTKKPGEQADILAPLLRLAAGLPPDDRIALQRAGEMAMRSVARTVEVRTLVKLSLGSIVKATPMLTRPADMLPSKAQFGAVERVLGGRQVPFETALLGGKSEELRELEERIAEAGADASALADAKFDLEQYHQREQKEMQLKIKALAEAAFARSERRGRIVSIYSLTPALARRFFCARQYWLFDELFALVERDASFWASFPYSQKDVADARQAFARLAALPLAEWTPKEADDAKRMLEEGAPPDEGDQSGDVLLRDSPMIVDAGRAIRNSPLPRPNGLRGGQAAFLAFGRAHYSSLKSYLDVLRELLDDVSLVEQDEHAAVLVSIADAMADAEQQIRSLDETELRISATDDFSVASVALQVKLAEIREMLRDRYYYDVAPKTGAEPAATVASLGESAYGMFDPLGRLVADGVAGSPWSSGGEEGSALVRLFSGPIVHALGTVAVEISAFVDHAGYLGPGVRRQLMLRNFLTGTLLAGGVVFDPAEAQWTAEKADGSIDFSAAHSRLATALFAGASREAVVAALKSAGEARRSWTRPLGRVLVEALKTAMASGREEDIAEALRSELGERASLVEDVAEQLHKRVPGLEDANMYRASVVLVLARRRADGTVALTCASIGDASFFALTYPLVTDARNVSVAAASMRELRADSLASSDVYDRMLESARLLARDPSVAGELAAALQISVLNANTTLEVGRAESAGQLIARLEAIGPNSKDVFARGRSYLSLFGSLSAALARFNIKRSQLYQRSIEARGTVSDRLSAGEFFSPQEARTLLEEQETEAEASDDKLAARLALARATAVVDYVNEISADSVESDTIHSRREAGGLVSNQLRQALKQWPHERPPSLAELKRAAKAEQRELLVWIEYGIALRSRTNLPLGPENEIFVRRIVEKSRKQSAQAARAAIDALTASKRRFFAWSWGFGKEKKVEVPAFFHLMRIPEGERADGRQRAYTLAFSEQILRDGDVAFAAPKLEAGKIVAERISVEQARKRASDLAERAPGGEWMVAFSAEAVSQVEDEDTLDLALAMQEKMLKAFEASTADQLLPLLRALRGLGVAGDDADARFSLPLPISSPDTPRDAERYREHVLVDKNSIGRTELVPPDLFLRPFSLVHYGNIKERVDAVRASAYSSSASEDALYEDYFSRIKLVCGVERSPFSIGNLWLKRKSCAATFEQIRSYAEANGSGSDYSDYLAGLYVSSDSRLVPIVPRDPAQLVRASAYQLSAEDRAYFFVSGNYFRFVGIDSFAREARRAARYLEAHVSLSALATIVKSGTAKDRLALLRQSAESGESSMDQLAAALGSQEAAEQIRAALAPGKQQNVLAERAAYSRVHLGTGDPEQLGAEFLARLRRLFDRHQDSFLREALQKDAHIEDSGALGDISDAQKLAAKGSRLNSQFGIAYFGPMSDPNTYLDIAATEIEAKLLDPRLFVPDVVLSLDTKGQTSTTSKFVKTRSRFLLPK